MDDGTTIGDLLVQVGELVGSTIEVTLAEMSAGGSPTLARLEILDVVDASLGDVPEDTRRGVNSLLASIVAGIERGLRSGGGA